MKTTKITPRLTELIRQSETSQNKPKQLPKPIDLSKLEGWTE
ncbi:MAG: hypothetical protein PUP93_28590 [Rhizonema sp. NSF051]|nr:hypothetical protein [Rhizonema sp. NSF051]